MSKFNKQEFGERLKKFRKEKGLSQENLANVINKNATTIGRFESGMLIPDAEEIYLICNELGIHEYELFETSDKLINNKESLNPFKVNTLYVYYTGYYPTARKFDKCKFKINIIEKQNYCAIEMVDYKTDRIYLTGYIEADNFMAFFKFNNYKPNNPRLECSQININLTSGVERLMNGVFFCTNGKYEPSLRKCFISKEDLDFTDKMLKDLQTTQEEIKQLQKINIWYANIENKEDFEE